MDDTQFLEDLRRRHLAGEALKYLFFWGHQPGKAGITSSCFSQWYEAPFVIDGQRYATAEHYMMAEKAVLFGDPSARVRVLQAPTPGAAKALGRSVSGFDEAVWVEHRFSIVVRANQAKFTQNPELGIFLKQSGARILVEASPVDSIWGIGLAQDDERAKNPSQWLGLNLLGFALMEIRNGL
ncbi:NADAR family protein [Telluria mixta]|uniref:NADAR family protein n=1 Tax=Telluria mixta TaxID=34071 RepID=A0ABT2C8I0_9BURK|nr:NADAR family protein [Telluria mixta]MCS0633683.1 NADAR family protein [Telluria mixta]WEM98103.1 NADAR family protein [Telluria mixta]